jgi:hypothetical protein
MFNWFGGKGKESNVVDFPKEYLKPVIPPVSEPANVFYRLGVTDNNRLAFQMGYSEVTMTKQGVQNLIEQLQVFRDQLQDDHSTDD